jgi:hypothetical protein
VQIFGSTNEGRVMPTDKEFDPCPSDAAAAAVMRANALNGSGLDALVTIGQAAALFHRTPRTLRNWRRRGWLRAVRIGGGLYFRAAEIEALLARGEAGAMMATSAVKPLVVEAPQPDKPTAPPTKTVPDDEP